VNEREQQWNSEFVLAGGGEMGARMRALDWTATPLGPVHAWPQSLRTCVRIILTSRQPMFVWWGTELINLYNDAYRSIVGGKHPTALGQPARVVWSEIWDQISPRAETAMRRNEGTYDEALLLIMERHGYPEETYYTFSYSPVPNDQGGTGGILCANTDDTRRIIGERQLALLRELATLTTGARSAEQACQRAAESLATLPRDLPFALLYLIDPSRNVLHLVAQSGIEPGHPAALPQLRTHDEAPWPVRAALRDDGPIVVGDLSSRFPALPNGAWHLPPDRAVAVALSGAGQAPAGLLVTGLNPCRLFDDDYRGFLTLLSHQIASAIATATAYQEERRRAEALAEIDRAKTTFFSNVSHEFRTPLTLMLGPTEDALEAGALVGEDLATVYRNELRLLKLVNNLLDFSRLEAGRARATFMATELALLTGDLASSFRAAMERAGLTFVVDCAPQDTPVYVDRDMWEKIVLNLLSNALKFTFEGSVTIALHSAPQTVRLSVSDTGTGIPQADLAHVFERFHRVEGVRSRTHEGSGIGLALVHELVRMHGGTISVRSELGKGTTFTIDLPLGKAHLPGDRIAETSAPAAVGAGAVPFVQEALRWLPDADRDASAEQTVAAQTRLPGEDSARILVADDNADMRDYLRRTLALHWNVDVVGDGRTALARVMEAPPDLVLTDVMMPELDGFGLLRALKGDATLSAIPVLMLSARAGEEARVEGLLAGADDYLVKPFSARELCARVRTHLNLARARARAERERSHALSATLALEQKSREASEANRAKDEFLAMLGHELRNPLAPIATALHLMDLRGGEHFAKERAIIGRQVKHLVRLVDDLLEVSRITRGKIALKSVTVDLADTINSALEMTSPLIEQRGHHLAVELGAGLVVLGDPSRLAQIFANLITNAAKYTPAGGQISISALHVEHEIVVRVRDTGVGIGDELLRQVFEPFVQERQPIDRSEGGLGLGLAIVRSLAVLHGGSVSASSDGPNLGSEFVVRLPAAPALAEITTAAVAPAAARPGADTHARATRGKQILVVDDNEDGAQALGELLTARGHAVELSYNPAEALHRLERYTPDVAFLDIGLPGMDGFELARRIRDEPRLAAIRLIALTGYGQAKDKAESAAAGFDAHLVKPIDVAALYRLLDDDGPAPVC
jgi:signal transduction histidine kinase